MELPNTESETVGPSSLPHPLSLPPYGGLSIDVLAHNALHLSEQSAFLVHDKGKFTTHSWHNVFSYVLNCRDWLSEIGIRPGDRVAWQLPNSLDWILLELACNWTGAISCPIDLRVPPHTVSRLLALVEPAHFLSQSNTHPGIRTTNPPALNSFTSRSDDQVQRVATNPWQCNFPRPVFDSAATLLFTSGTTGDTPKAVTLSHRNLMLNAAAKLKAMPQSRSDHRINLLPFAHAYARTCELTSWLLSGSSLECVGSIPQLLERLPASQATLLNAVPLVYQRIYEQWKNAGGSSATLQNQLGLSMRQLASGGAPIPEELRSEFSRAGYPIFQGYGLTETSPVVCSNIRVEQSNQHCLSGVGPPVEGMEIRVDEDSNLFVKGSGVMLGYWNDPQATQSRFHDLDGTGAANWFSTGDIAHISPVDGSIHILGRSDETIVLTNGYKLHPLALETTIKTLAGVHDCIVLPTNDGRWQALLQIANSKTTWSELDWLQRIRSLCSPETRNGLTRVQLHVIPWTSENGLLNFKGGKRRREFLSRFVD